MKQKINIAELLKDCPSDMELNCVMNENVYFDKVLDDIDSIYPIRCYIIGKSGIKNSCCFTKYGEFSTMGAAKCVIFPKGKTTWEGFPPPCKFKDGDVVFYNDNIAIFKEWGDETLFRTYVTKYLRCDSLIDINTPLYGKGIRREIRFATEEEKSDLFQTIRDNGYCWNAEKKILEKLPKFKVGDTIKNKNDKWLTTRTIQCYVGGIGYFTTINDWVRIDDQDEWELVPDKFDKELVPDKFDINTLKPFDKVLVRDCDSVSWTISFYSHYDAKDNFPCHCMHYGRYKQCIPYNGNEYLLNTTKDCIEFYKNW